MSHTDFPNIQAKQVKCKQLKCSISVLENLLECRASDHGAIGDNVGFHSAITSRQLPGCHTTGWELCYLVVKVDTTHSYHIHLICWVVQRSEIVKQGKSNLSNIESVFWMFSYLSVNNFQEKIHKCFQHIINLKPGTSNQVHFELKNSKCWNLNTFTQIILQFRARTEGT